MSLGDQPTKDCPRCGFQMPIFGSCQRCAPTQKAPALPAPTDIPAQLRLLSEATDDLSVIALLRGAAAALERAAKEPALPPDDLHPKTRDLLSRFSNALAEKLSAAEKKYGYTDAWRFTDWEIECRAKLREHIEKGDPRDVAAYCAFMWHHGWSTSGPTRRRSQAGDESDRIDRLRHEEP